MTKADLIAVIADKLKFPSMRPRIRLRSTDVDVLLQEESV
jgi:hypothetical protein